jgi:YegS/Rv2252/BmrU family lipid kinase
MTAAGYVVLNPVAGDGKPDAIRALLRESLGANGYDLYETSGDESIPDVVRAAVADHDYDWVAAVGGDGTVSAVANGLVKSGVPLAILPAGTGNALAKELGIPQEIEDACRLLSGDAATRAIDAIRVDDHYFFLQLGIGLEAKTMEETSSEVKNRWGPVAYLWSATKAAFGWQPHRFALTLDGGQTQQLEASELVVANAAQVGVLGFEWHDDIRPDDGRLDIAVVRARSLGDYAQVLWGMLAGRQHEARQTRFFTCGDSLRLEAEGALPVHGDGEVLERSLPITAAVVPHALNVLVPRNEA